MAQEVTTPANKFPKSNRLLKHSDFQRVYEKGRRQFTGNMTLFYLRRQAADAAHGPRIGFTVGRALGGAVERNRIKRKMREAVRLSLSKCQGVVDIVFNPRKSVSSLPFAQLKDEVARGLQLAMQRARAAEEK